MKKSKAVMFALSGAVTLIVAVFISFYVSSNTGGRDFIIELPPRGTGDLLPGKTGFYTVGETPDIIEISPENVQVVIGGLNRNDKYFQEFVKDQYWQGGSASTRSERYCMSGCSYIRLFNRSGVMSEHYIVTDRTTYIWNDGARQYWSGTTGTITSDDDARVPTYESILTEDKESIASCSYKSLGNEDCIFVEVVGGSDSERYWVSLATGLLVMYEKYSGETMVTQIRQTAYSTTGVYEALFALPDGNNVLQIIEDEHPGDGEL